MSVYQLQHLFSETTARLPWQPAVRFGTQELTYAELFSAAERLAAGLRAHGLRRGDRVGILIPRSTAAPLAILSTLVAGGVCVPLDPAAPALRLAYVARDCGIRHVITTGRQVTTVAAVRDMGAPIEAVLTVDGPAPADEVPSGVRVADLGSFGPVTSVSGSAGTECDMAYILYTSGSTGRPKGVMLSHRNVLSFVEWAAQQFQLEKHDVVSNHAPLHFDLSIFDIFASASRGALIAHVPDQLALFPIRLAEWIARTRVTVWYSVPSVLTLLATRGALAEHDFEALRLVLFSGEVFPIKYLRRCLELLPRPRYFNLYGPTETNVVTYQEVVSPVTRPVSIGVACANTEVFALRDDGQMASIGEAGELCARGPNVALGYWGQPERTAMSFVQNPLEPGVPDRVYRTGDVVEVAHDGRFLFRGRRDRMVKSRGYRVELGEIEAVLLEHLRLREAVVVGVPHPELGSTLCAFVVDPAQLDLADVLRHCRERLPAYMVPERWESLSELPKTSNGKVDLARLADRPHAAPVGVGA
jgi:amino acid adenylation domain-containing protein